MLGKYSNGLVSILAKRSGEGRRRSIHTKDYDPTGGVFSFWGAIITGGFITTSVHQFLVYLDNLSKNNRDVEIDRLNKGINYGIASVACATVAFRYGYKGSQFGMAIIPTLYVATRIAVATNETGIHFTRSLASKVDEIISGSKGLSDQPGKGK